jgi:hypothetical protein
MTTFLLSNTPTSAHRVRIEDAQVTLSQEITFPFDAVADIPDLMFFLEAVKKDKEQRHTYTALNYIWTYDPANSELELFSIIRRGNGRRIGMGWSTAGRLLLALLGQVERLVEDK